jgi:hypothetical protein
MKDFGKASSFPAQIITLVASGGLLLRVCCCALLMVHALSLHASMANKGSTLPVGACIERQGT